MINFESMEVISAQPASIIRRSKGSSSKLTEKLLDLDMGHALLIHSDDEEDRKTAQRRVNVVMKGISKTHPEYVFVTRTISSEEYGRLTGSDVDDSGSILGVYRIDTTD